MKPCVWFTFFLGILLLAAYGTPAITEPVEAPLGSIHCYFFKLHALDNTLPSYGSMDKNNYWQPWMVISWLKPS
jgi:hypothetical protein